LLADFTKDVTRRYGILKEELGAGYRGTFIIDPTGVCRSMVVNDLPVGRSVSETLRTLQALQTGELCPIDWKPGSKTLGK
jgi:alkyl hydroperoxide reductase subunit AhpC